MSNANRIYSRVFTCRQIQVFLLQELLVDQSLLQVLVIEFIFTLVFKQVLVQILHNTVFYAFTVELHLFIRLGRKQIIELLSHLAHQLLYVCSLIFSIHPNFYDFRQHLLHKLFEHETDWICFVAFQLIVELVKYTLLLLFFRLFYWWL